MALVNRLQSFVRHLHLRLTTTVLVVLIYVAIGGLFLYTDQLSSVPSKGSQQLAGLDLSLARQDLENIAAHPHPYNSHANDAVRDYIHNRLKSMAEGRDFLYIDDDVRSNGSWSAYSLQNYQRFGVYFEGTNLLVKIDGTDQVQNDAVLFSAHYDSVSTSPGATDNGMGVVALLQLIEYFASNRQKKTAIFNINNGAQDRLNGAHAFMKHPWSNLTTTFINLEGAAAGGRPIIFRSTSLKPLRGFHAAPHAICLRQPHGNIMFSTGYARSVIESGTDYEVYTNWNNYDCITNPTWSNRMEGVDIVSYKAEGRSRAQTRSDTVSSAMDDERSLWGLIEYTRGLGYALLNEGGIAPNSIRRVKAGIYFDFLKMTFVSFDSEVLVIITEVFMVAGPLVLLLLYAIAMLIGPRVFAPNPRRLHMHASVPDPSQESGSDEMTPPSASPGLENRQSDLTTDGTTQSRNGGDGSALSPSAPEMTEQQPTAWGIWAIRVLKDFILRAWMHLSFWAAMYVTIRVQHFWITRLSSFHPLAAYSNPHLTLLCGVSLAYLTAVSIIKSGYSNPWLKSTSFFGRGPAPQTTLLLHLYLLALGIIVLEMMLMDFMGSYTPPTHLLTAWYISVWCASAIGTLDWFLDGAPGKILQSRRTRGYSAPNRGYDSVAVEDSGTPGSSEHATERTPLLSSPVGRTIEIDGSTSGTEGGLAQRKEEGAINWCNVQVLVAVPVLLAMSIQIAMLGVEAEGQTLVDGSSAETVYAGISWLVWLILMPIVPFAPRLHRAMTYLALLTFVCTTAYLHWVFPFTLTDPLKLRFQQRVELDPRSVFSDFETTSAQMTALSRKSNISYALPRTTTTVTGHPLFLRQVLSSLPSTAGSDLNCTVGSRRNGLSTCEWDSGAQLDPSPGGRDPWALNDTLTVPRNSSFFKANITRTGWGSANISIHGRNTRNCRIYFDSPDESGVKVWKYTVAGGAEGSERWYSRFSWEGLRDLRLWSRTWDRTWDIQVHWKLSIPYSAWPGDEEDSPNNGDLTGKIACQWAEYASGMGGSGGEIDDDERAQIPAFEEVLRFLPEWAAVTKLDDGLVEAWVPFTI